MNLRLGALVACAVLLTSCMVGPKYKQPSTPVPLAFKEQPPESFKESDGWKPSQPADQMLRGKWWELFGDSKLNELEEQVTISNQDLRPSKLDFAKPAH